MINDDFDDISWHDSKVYSITFPDAYNSIEIDIDFIIEWIKKETGNGYKFLVVPAILKFENVSNLFIKINTEDFAEVFVDELKRENKRLSPNGKVFMWDFILLLNGGIITFTSTGYIQEFTATPKLGEEQKYDR